MAVTVEAVSAVAVAAVDDATKSSNKTSLSAGAFSSPALNFFFIFIYFDCSVSLIRVDENWDTMTRLSERESYTLVPIGYVRRPDQGMPSLVIYEDYCPALLNVDRFSHLIVLWWISGRDNLSDRSTVVVIPRGGRIPEVSGVFSCRSPARPNPIGHSVVKIISVDMESCTVTIDQIDANNDSPIIDMKPYLPSSDRVDNAVVAPWFTELKQRYSSTEK